MTGINENVFYCATRIQCEFADNIGNEKRISGTGFSISHNGHAYLVTNKHNLDPRLKYGPQTGLQLKSVKIQLRKVIATPPYTIFQPWWGDEIKFFAYKDLDKIIYSRDADVAILPDFHMEADAEKFGLYSVMSSFLANETEFSSKIKSLDAASFLGYPGTASNQWWDTNSHTPIARTAFIASRPYKPIANEGIKTTDAVLVSGLSFSGSSGSMLILHQKGLKPGDIIDPDFVEPRIIGIMSGHWWEQDQEIPDMFRHSGLSYFTRSTSILKLLEDVDITKLEN